MHRFRKGDIVHIGDVIATQRAGKQGRVIDVKPSKRGARTLDKYVVEFPDGQTKEFWDIQLEMSKGEREDARLYAGFDTEQRENRAPEPNDDG